MTAGAHVTMLLVPAVRLSGVRVEDSGAAAGAMHASQQPGAALGAAMLVP